MANNRVVVNFDFKANTQDVQNQLNSLKTNLQQIIGQSSKINIGGHINTQLKDAVGAAQSLQKHLTASFNTNTGQLDLAKFNASLKSSNQNVTVLGKQLLGAGAEGKAAFMGLATSLTQAEIPAVRLSATMGKLMTTFANNARWMISSFVLTGFVSGIKEAVDYTKDLNESLTDIRIVTGKSSEEMDRLAKSANKMAKELKTSTAEIVKGQLIYYQQGDSAELAAKKAEITTKAANVSFGTSQEQMSEYLTAIWNSYQVGEENLEQFVDVLAAVGATTATSMEEIATAMQKVAATGNAVGVSYEQLTATIATISSVTRTSSEQVGTALKTIYARIGDLKAGGLDEDDIGLGQVSSGLKKVGVEILDTNNNIRDMGEVVEEIGTKWEGWTEAQQQAIVQLIAGKRQYTQMMALFENWDMYESTLATAEGADGELNKQQEIWAESWEAASQNVQASLESLYSQIFDDDVFIDFLNGLNLIIEGIDGITDLFGGLGNTLLILSTLLVQRFSIPLADGLRNAAMQAKLLFDFKNKGYQETESQVAKMLDSIKALSLEEQAQLNNLKQEIELKTKYASISGQLNQSQKQEYATSMQILQILQNRYQEQSKTLDLAKKEASVLVNNAKQNFKNDKVDYQKDRYATIINNYEKAFLNEFKEYPEIQSQVEAIFNEFKEGGISIDQARTKLNAMLNELGGEGTSSHSELKSMFGDFENSAKFAGDRVRELDILLEQLDAPFLSENSENQFNGQTLDKAIQKYGQLSGSLEYYRSGLNDMKLNTVDAEARQSQLNTVLSAAELIYQGNDEKIKRLTKSLMSADLSSEEFEAILKQINQDLAGKITTADKDFEEIAHMLNSAGVEGKELATIIDKIKSGAILTEAEIDKLNGKFRQTKKDLETPSIKGWSNWAMDISTAMMSLMSIINALKSAFDTFNNPDATGWEKFSAVISVVTTVLMSISMLYPVVSGIVVASNTAMAASAAGTATAAQAMWASILGPIGIAVIAIAAVVGAIVAIGAAIHETDIEKLERLNKEVEEVNEKYNKQKSIIDELNEKKEAGADNQAQLDALDAEIAREERKLELIEQQKEAKEEEKNKQEVKVEQEKYNKGGSISKRTYNNLNDVPDDLNSKILNDMTIQGQDEFQKMINSFEQGKISFQEIQNEIQNNASRYYGAEFAEESADAAIEALDKISEETENNLQENLDSLELFTKNGAELTDNFLGTFRRNLHAVYGDSLGPDVIAAIASYYSGIEELSDTELQSLLEKLFPEEDKNTLVERFRQGLQEIDGEMDKFGKKETLAKSLENADKAIDKVQSALKEIDDTGFVSYSTIEEIATALDKAGVASAEWKQALYDANGNAEKTKEVLSQIVNEIANATIEAQKFSENLHFNDDGSLTGESQEYVDNVEKMIAAQLRSNGVQNATEIAHKKVAAATMKARIEQQNLANELPQTEEALYDVKNAAYAYATYLATADFTYTSVDSIKNLEDEYLAILGLISGYETLANIKTLVDNGLTFDSSGGYRTYKKDGKTYFVDPNTRKQYDSSGAYIGTFSKEGDLKSLTYHNIQSDIKKAGEKLKENTNNFDGGDNKFKVKEVNPSDGGGKKDPAWKIEYEKRLEQIEYEAERDGLSKLELGRKLRELYNEYYGHMFEIEDEETGKTYEKYFFDKAKDVISNLKDGLTEAFDDELANAKRTGVYDYAKLSTLLSDTLKQAAIEGVTFSEEEKNELIDTYVSGVQGLMSEASSDLDTKFENQEFFSGIINLDEKMAGYNDLLKTAQDYLKDLENNEATIEQLAEYENSVVIPLIKKKRDLLKEEADAAKEATEHYIKMSEFYGYKNGDNEIKARERTYKRMLNLTEEQILAEYGTYQEYWYALEEERLEIDQIFRDKLKEALEKEKDDRIAILEAEKNAAEKLFEGENTLREKRKQINDQLQESLTMYQYLDKATRKLIFNEEDYFALSNTLNEIEEDMYDLNQKYLRDIVGKEADELEYINAEYERQNELLMNRYEIAEKELGVIKARTKLENTLKERNTQMFINGRWQWVADQKAIIEAQKELNDAEFDLETSELENEQELLINSFEKQIDNANKAWEKATKVLEDKVMTVAELMSSLSEPMDDLTKKFYELATGSDSGGSSSESSSRGGGGRNIPTVPGSDPNYNNATATIPGVGTVGVQIKNGKTTTTNLPVGTVVHTAGGDFKITGGTGGNYTSVKIKSANAEGSRSVVRGLGRINEIGEETFVTPDGHFRNFAGGEVIFTHEQSQRLFSLLNADLFDINKMPRVGEFEQSNSNDTYISIGGISIDTTTQDGKDLVEILQRITNI